MIIEFYCPICMELYQNTDYAYTTLCGHVFHERCLQSWLTRSGTCPECRRNCASSSIFKIFIKSRNSEQLVELQKKLDQKILAITEMEDKLAVCEQEQLQFIRDKEFSKVLSECLENEINEKRLEIKTLREDLASKEKNNDTQPTTEKVCEKEISSTNLEESEAIAKKNQIIKDLESKLSEKSLELEKEIRNSTMLIVDKMKLQQQLIDAGISGTMHRGNKLTAETNKLNHQVKKSLHNANTSLMGAAGGTITAEANKRNLQAKKSLHNANTTLTGAAGGVENTNGATKKRVDKPVFDLYMYAKKLHKVGFKSVFFCEENIFARKEDTADKIQIFSRTQVDALFKHFKSLCTNAQQASATPKPTQCDENYYAL